VRISVIIPTFNEEQAIGSTVLAVLDLKLNCELEILVVDDGSSDGTARVAAAAGAKVLSHPYNIGNGAAVKTGIRNATGDVLVFMDGDGQHDPAEIPHLVCKISKYHMVVGARDFSSQAGWHRGLANMLYNQLASFVSDFDVKDLTSGYRAMRRDDALRFCDMFPNTFSYPTTSTLAFVRSGRSVAYIPIIAHPRVGTSKIRILRDGFEFLIIIMKISMTFAPFRIFLPISSFLFFAGLGRYAYTYLVAGQFTAMSGLLLNSSVIVFMLGLISEQIAALRFERGDKLFAVEDQSKYLSLKDLGRSDETGPDESSRGVRVEPGAAKPTAYGRHDS
jgi:glycosyltransferase involved in cell wall biosynthesis